MIRLSRVFVDVNVPMYAAGTPHPLREPSQRVVIAIVSGEIDAVTDAEVFQEILYRYIHIGEREKGFRIFDHFHQIMLGRTLAIEQDDVAQARTLAERYPQMSPRDLIHLSVMLRHQISEVISADRSFGAVEGIRRIDPSDFPVVG